MDLSVCIVNWNTKELLAACLDTVFQEIDRGLAAEVIVVDNGSSDGSPEIVGSAFERAHLIRNSVNLGFARANNQAVDRARGRYVLLLNSDTLVSKDSLRILLDYMEEHPECGALGPMILNPDGTLQVSAARFPRLRNAALGGVFSNEVFRRVFPGRRFFAELGLTAADHAECQSVDWLLGCCLLLPREALLGVGGLDEDIFFFYEEADLCKRLKDAGWQVLYYPAATIVHLGGGSYSKVWTLDEQVGRQLRGLEYFHRKHYGFLDLAALRLLTVGGSAAKVLVFASLAVLRPKPSRGFFRAKAAWHLATLAYYARRLDPRHRLQATPSNRPLRDRS
jgi:N-acetylglucosaminyl-diphospho-decaprenol L-rhamnosyltransferase